jgi:hypothetical protein
MFVKKMAAVVSVPWTLEPISRRVLEDARGPQVTAFCETLRV